MKGGANAHKQFRRTSAKGDHRQADYQLGNPQNQSQGDGALDEQFAASKQQGDSD